jgi:CrcB protein
MQVKLNTGEGRRRRALFLYSQLTFYGMLGTLARLGLTRLTSFEGSLAGGVLWANFGGSLLMGILKSWDGSTSSLLNGDHKPIVGPKYKSQADIPWFVGVTTGLYGSFTSFSSFIEVMFNVSAHKQVDGLYSYPNPGYGVMALIAYAILTMAVSVGGYKAGSHIAKGLKELSIPVDKFEAVADVGIMVIGVSGWIVVLVLAVVMNHGSWRYWSLCCVFSPFGVFVRYIFAQWWNRVSKRFMFGTFAANVLGTTIMSILLLLQTGKSMSGNGPIVSHRVRCTVISGLRDGFCGSLTTISTFAAECNNLKRLRDAYSYAFISIAVSYIIMVLIRGVYIWVHGSTTPVCQ